jgi:hypothetical protein
MLALVTPKPDAEDYKHVGQARQIVFLTEDVGAKYHEWLERGVAFLGSAQEFVETRILGCFLKNDEFGLSDGHALGLEQQVAEILVAATPPNETFDVAVDGFHHTEAYFGAAVVQDPVQVIRQHKGKFLKGCQPLPAQLIDPTVQIAHHGPFIAVGPQALQAFL